MADKLKMHSPDLVDGNIESIAELFPGCVTESRGEDGNPKRAIDFDLLRQELSDHIVEGPQERYRLDWPGKREALLAANAPIAKTLRPCREESVDFDTTQNLFIEGDNLDALKLLQETYLGKVKMIYIDPPYNTGRDFIYRDDFAENPEEFLKRSLQTNDLGSRLLSNPEYSGRYHSNWLTMMSQRLRVARNLLADDGVIFMSIDDIEVDNLKKLGNEVFGENNFIGCAGRITKKSNNKGEFWAPNFDYIITFAKDARCAQPFFGGVNFDAYKEVDSDGPRAGEPYQLVRLYMSTIQNRNPDQRFWIECPDGTRVIPPGSTFPPERPHLGDGIWRWTKRKFEAERDRIVVKRVRSSNLVSDTEGSAEWNVYTKTYLSDVIKNATAKPNSFIEGFINQQGSHELGAIHIPFSYSKPSSLIEFLAEISKTSKGDVILDFFGGSGTTAESVLRLNLKDGAERRYVIVQLPEEIDESLEAYKKGYRCITELAKERIRRTGKKIKTDNAGKEGIEKLDTGFRVLKIDTSNMADVYYRPDTLEQGDLLGHVANVKPDRSAEDLLFQVLLDWGVDLGLPIVRESVDGREVFFVDDNALAACFVADGSVDEDFVKQLAARKPLRVVFRDAGFANDNARINVEQIFRTLSPATDVRTL